MRDKTLNFKCLWGLRPHKHLKFRVSYPIDLHSYEEFS